MGLISLYNIQLLLPLVSETIEQNTSMNCFLSFIMLYIGDYCKMKMRSVQKKLSREKGNLESMQIHDEINFENAGNGSSFSFDIHQWNSIDKTYFLDNADSVY